MLQKRIIIVILSPLFQRTQNQHTMKAIVYHEYGKPEVLQIEEIEKPAPKDNEVLIKIHATTVNYGDILARNFKNTPRSEFNMPLILWFPARLDFGINKPRKKILGSEFSGVIEATGAEVKEFKVGDPVFGYLGQKMGAYAQYVCISEKGDISLKPKNMSFEEAATVPYGTLMALNLLKKVNIKPGQKVLINGASGGIGFAAVQLAKHHFGAEVTGVCSTPRMAFVNSLGADHVIDYTSTDFTQNGESYDLIFDVLGRSSFSKCKKSLRKNGRYLLASFKTKQLGQMLWTKIVGDKKVICGLAIEKQDDLIFIKKLIEEGKIKSIIDKSFPMDQIAEAHRYVENGKKKGNVVVNMVDGK